jgi:hypothetical protein
MFEKTLSGAVALAAAVLVVGCGQEPAKPDGAAPKAVAKAEREAKAHDHSGWWCDEHGIPEAECSLCSSKVAREFKAKGDWCDKHDRAKSQCFVCDPSLKEQYAAKYRAKYGKEPPAVEEEGDAGPGEKK